MARGFKTGGRKAGTPNRRRKLQAEAAAKLGTLPAELLLKTARGEATPGIKKPTRIEIMEARKAAAPYYQPRLAATLIEQVPRATKRSDLSRIEIARAVAFAMAEAAELVKRQQGTGAPQVHAALSPPIRIREVDRREQPQEPVRHIDVSEDQVERAGDVPQVGEKMVVVNGRLMPEGLEAAEHGMQGRRYVVTGGRPRSAG